MSREVAASTVDLRQRWDKFKSEMEQELASQETKKNLASERRMRTLLRSFREGLYVPYRDGTLRNRED